MVRCLDDEAAGMWNRPPWSAPSASHSIRVAATTRKASLPGPGRHVPALSLPGASSPAPRLSDASCISARSVLPCPDVRFRRAVS